MRLSLPFVLLLGCHDGPGDKPDTGIVGDDTGDTDTPGDTAPPDRGEGNITGLVTVQLYQTDEDGEIVELSWEEYGEQFPFGAIYVAAYTIDETTNETTYYDEYVISAPTTGGDTYSLAVDLDDTESVHVYAALDWWPDGVIGTSEPIGIYEDLVPIAEDETVEDVDIVITSPLLPSGGGGGGTYVTLSGDVTIDQEYGGGDGKVMLYDSAGNGPSYSASFTPTATETGATATFSLAVGAEYGAGRLLGAWDNDQNGLIDPTDTWGAYVVEGENANPITIESSDITDLPVVIPYGLPPALTPFVRIDGTLTYADDFSTLPSGTTVYVVALRARSNEELTVADLDNAHDWQAYTGAELSGTTLDYTLVAPSSTIAYLWAYADTDADGILNEAGEPVASYSRSGRISTGTASQSGLDMELRYVLDE